MTRVVVASQPAELARSASDWLEHEVTSAIAKRGACALGLAGGRTPEPVYRELASAPGIDWKRVDVFFGDERAVPPDHADSNYFMVHRALLSGIAISDSSVHRMHAEWPDREAAAREYERVLPPRLDILILGMGADGHTASLFPGSAAMDERERLVVPVVGAKPPAERLTLTPPAIEAARELAVIATGEDKAAMAARALEGPLSPKEIPIQLARRGVWFLDRAAAAQLTTQVVAG
jgi:6-phosphogluconolactonase